MVTKELEIRGIPRIFILDYMVELGGTYNEELDLFQGAKWESTVSKEAFFCFQLSDIPKVFVTFRAEKEEDLQELIRKFRVKTIRVGG